MSSLSDTFRMSAIFSSSSIIGFSKSKLLLAIASFYLCQKLFPQKREERLEQYLYIEHQALVLRIKNIVIRHFSFGHALVIIDLYQAGKTSFTKEILPVGHVPFRNSNETHSPNKYLW